MACEGCTARATEIDYLRQQNRELTERLFAATSPEAYAQMTGKGAPQVGGVERMTVGNETFAIVQGRAIRQDDFDRFIAERGGYLDNKGQIITQDEYDRTMRAAEQAWAGGAIVEEQSNGSHRAADA
jgi:hypothetical protein